MFDFLKGVKVLDVTTIVLGPYAGQLLGDFGADVIKLESLEGDLFRAVLPMRSEGMGAGFLNSNRNKRSIAANLKTDQGKRILEALVGWADVLVHNMRPPAAARLGMSYEALHARHSRLVYCVSSGFGQDGPYADQPAYDDIMQGASGFAALNGGVGGTPRFVPTIVCDKIAGLHLALGALAGVVRRERTGEGCYIEAPMLESNVAFLMVEQLAGRSYDPPLGPTGYERLSSPYRRPYETRDGHIAALPYTTRHWKDFCAFIGETDLPKEPWFDDVTERSRNVTVLYEAVARVMPTRTTAEWVAILGRLDIPCAPVNAVDDLLDDPHLRATGFFETYEHPSEGWVVQARSPYRVLAPVGRVGDRPPARLGEHSREILAGLGFGEEEIEDFVASGAVGVESGEV